MNPLPSRLERFQEQLLNDGLTPAEANDLLNLGAALEQWSAPTINPVRKARVLATLAKPYRFTSHLRYALTLIRAQMRIVRREIWIATTFSILLGVIVTVLVYANTEAIALALIAPLVAAVGIAFIYGPDTDPPLEILLSVRTPPRLVLLARLVLVFGFDLLLALGASLLLSGVLPLINVEASASAWALITLWLAPMVFLSALAFFTSILFTDSLVGVMVSLCAWFVMCGGYLSKLNVTLISILPDFTASSAQLPLWIAAIVLLSAAFWLGGREEHWVSAQ